MKRNVVFIILFEIAIMLLLIFSIIFGVLKNNLKTNSIESSESLAYSILKNYQSTSLTDQEFTDLYKNAKNDIAIIDLDGTVIANSSVYDTIDDALNLPEVIDLEKAIFRRSDKLDKQMLYITFSVANDKLIRLGIPQQQALNRFYRLSFIAIVLALILMIVMYLLLNLERRNYLKNMNNLLSDIRIKREAPTYEINQNIYESFDDLVILLNQVLIKDDNGSKETLRILLNEINQGIILVNSDTEIVLSNRLANQLLEIKEGEKVIFQIRDKSVYEVIIDAVNKPINEVMAITYKNKHIRVSVSSVSSHILAKNNKTGALIVVSDDTERYLLDKNKRDFFANASHELRSPLTSIKGSAELINLKMVNEKDQQTLSQQIIDNVTIMDELIGDMLELSRLQSNPPKVHNKVELAKLIKEILELNNLNIFEKELTVNLKLDEIDYYGAEQDFRSLFKNLIENAIKYNKEKGTIDVSLIKEEKGFTFIVKDSGIGIAEDNISRIFERFYQVDKARHLGNHGAGLGLAIVKHLIILYDGTVNVESTVDKETTFTVKIPSNS